MSSAGDIQALGGTDRVFLLPGEMAFVREPCSIETLLGSCVAVALHDPARRFGGMNHFMVPTRTGALEAGKIGELAVPKLIQLAGLSGCQPSALRATVIGGGAVVGHLAAAAEVAGLDVGRRNAACAVQLLRQAGIAIARQEVGGIHGRRVSFDTVTGAVGIRQIAQTAEREQRSARLAELRQRKGRILLIDDSATVRRLLRAVIERSDDLEVCGEAEDPFRARDALLALEPDALCLDVIMPKLDGLSFLRRLMQYKPIPTVVVSTIAKAGSTMERNLKDAGAIAVIDKDALAIHAGYETAERALLPALRRAVSAVVHKTLPTQATP
jgi:chemotaxis receptor (MCP) glutamine deamidase CheD/CheY-like chemotaxis protein